MAELDYGIVKNIEDLQKNLSDGLIHSAELTNQQDINEAYNAFIEQNWADLGAEIYTEFPKLKIRLSGNVKEDFINSVVDTDKFQEKNILINAEMWDALMQTPKQLVNLGMFQQSVTEKDTKSSTIRSYNFSFLSKGKIYGTNQTGLFLTTIHFKLPIKKTIIASGIMKTTIAEFDRLMQQGSRASLYEICHLAEKTIDFSIHQYYLQRGLENGCASSAILLTRYDHCVTPHKNDVLPRMYENNVYKKYTTLPHFHFNSSFGNIYKLNNKNFSYNNGVGYAISVEVLDKYLEELQFASPGDVFAENSFGMPFLKMRNKSIENIQYKLNNLARAIKEKNSSQEVRMALDVVLAISNIKLDLNQEIQEDRIDENSSWLR